MSRFVAQNAAGQKFAYGFDNPLQEYFLQKLDGETVDLVGSGSFPPVAGTNGKFLQAVEDFGIILPEDHLQEVVFDLPFSKLEAI